jgi:membrane-associated phospholipid phosphatase
MTARRLLVALALLGLVPRAAHAAGDGQLDVDEEWTWGIVLVVGGAYELSEGVFKKDLAPASCRWCSTNDLDDAAREALLWNDTTWARHISDAGLVIAPMFSIGMLTLAADHDDHLGNWHTDASVVLESGVIAMGVDQIVKFAVGRERPFVHVLPADQKGKTAQPEDNNLSFFSGHTTWTFALAVGAGTVAQLRGYRYAPWVWAGGLTIAATTGYMRIASDKHYLTDVLTSAAVGGLIGWGVPCYFHRHKAGDAQLVGAPSKGGLVVGVAFVW